MKKIVNIAVHSKKVVNLMDLTQWRLTPYQVLVLGFAVLIFFGAFLLTFPAASRSGSGNTLY